MLCLYDFHVEREKDLLIEVRRELVEIICLFHIPLRRSTTLTRFLSIFLLRFNPWLDLFEELCGLKILICEIGLLVLLMKDHNGTVYYIEQLLVV